MAVIVGIKIPNDLLYLILNWTGTLVIAILMYFLGKSRGRQERINAEFNNEAKIFRDAFKDTVIQLENRKTHVCYLLGLPITLEEHKKAMDSFIVSLSGIKKRRFKRTCNDYENYCKKQQRLHTHNISQLQKAMKSVFEDKKLEPLKVQPDEKEIKSALKYINKLLSFAETK